MQRRDLLKNVGLLSAASIVFPSELVAENGPKNTNDKTVKGRHHTFSWINDIAETKPKYVWENREDVIYHELFYPDEQIQTAPEFYALMRTAWVFNRNMRWYHAKNKSIIAHGAAENINLSGDKSAADWYSDPANAIYSEKEYTVFEKKSVIRKRDAAVLPAFQFHLAQHPILKVEVATCTTEWQFVISRKGRSGAPIFSSGWRKGKASVTFDLAAKIKSLGLTNPYAELHFAIGTWSENVETTEKIVFKAELVYSPAIVACFTPIAKTGNFKISVFAPQVSQIHTEHTTENPVFTKIGDYWEAEVSETLANTAIVISAGDGKITPATLWLRKPKGEFATYNKKGNFVEINGEVIKPLTGSYQGNFYFKDGGLPTETLMNTQQEWDSWNKNETPGEHQHAWESLSTFELQSRFAYVKSKGWDLVHLHSHYGIWERFDAVGNLCPHGIEQFNQYVQTAEQNGLKVMITLSSYPYGEYAKVWDEGTTPYKQYLEAGFKKEDWQNTTNQPFNSIYSKYILDFASIYKNETAIFSISSSGEGDWKGGFERNKWTFNVYTSIDKNHITVSEPVMAPSQLLPKQVAKFTTDLVGDRNYGFGQKMLIDLEMGILFRLNQMVPNMYLSESNYPSSNNYCHMVHNNKSGEYEAIIGTNRYRNLIRDTLYMGFIRQQPILMSWDEYFTEDEHSILSRVKKQIDWKKPIKKTPVAVLINDELATWDGRLKLEKLEATLSAGAVEYQFIENLNEKTANQIIIDATQKVIELGQFDTWNNFPKVLQKSIPIQVSKPYATQYLEWSDQSQFVAYCYNRSYYQLKNTYIHPNKHRIPVKVSFELMCKNINKTAEFQLFDLTNKKLIMEGKVKNTPSIKISDTDSDYLFVAFS